MRRILLLLAVVVLMAAMINTGAASASPTLASPEEGTFIDRDSDGEFDMAVQPGITADKVPIHIPINPCGNTAIGQTTGPC